MVESKINICHHPECNEPTNRPTNKYCSKSCSTSHRNIINWKDDSYRNNQSIISSRTMTKLWEDDSFKSIVSESSSNTLTKLWSDGRFRVGMLNMLSENASTQMIEQWKDPEFRKSREGEWFNTKKTIVHGLNCYSSYEVRFIDMLYNLNLPLPRNCESVCTPTGHYYPDFEYDEFYVEVKSTWSLEKSIIKGQDTKIHWCHDNIKPVEIINLDEMDTFKYLQFLLNNK